MTEDKKLLHFLNIFFYLFHSVLIIFILTGWIWRETRILHLTAIALTLFSWLILGFKKGFGYCICTDLHWQTRIKLGLKNDDNGYIYFLVKTLIGKSFSPHTVSIFVYSGLALCTLLSIWLNIFSK